jgi:hypothetical protein
MAVDYKAQAASRHDVGSLDWRDTHPERAAGGSGAGGRLSFSEMFLTTRIMAQYRLPINSPYAECNQLKR